tara:strand:- start:3483 stop:4085 length:603 start_codon:yes stop_codon:yes gene_type:complete
MSLQHAVDTPEGEFINESITATVKFPAEKEYSGRKFYTALLEDGQFKANVSCNTDLFTMHTGKRMQFSVEGKGKGFSMKRKANYNDGAQLGFGDNVSVSPAGEATPGQQAATEHSASVQAHPTPAPAQQRTSASVEGVTVGMAINKAVDLAIAEGNAQWNNGQRVKELASDLIRIAHDLQAGNLSIPANAPEDRDDAVPF